MTQAKDFESFIDLLSWRAAEHPELTAFRFFADGEHETSALSYGELIRQARVLAAGLQEQNLQGKRVLLLYPPGMEFIPAFIGCLFAGVIPVPAYPPEPHRLKHTLQRLQNIIQDARSPAVLTDSLILAQARQLMQQTQHAALGQLQWLQSDRLIAEGSDAGWIAPKIAADDLAFLQYTSGSTAQPKGVMISHGNLKANQEMFQAASGHCERAAKLVCWVPFYHDMGLVGHLLNSLYVGGETLIMPPVVFLKYPLRWLKLISDHRATSTGAPNFAYDLCVRKISAAERDALDLSCLTFALNAAEPVHASTIESFNAWFAPSGFAPESMAPSYGMAETTVFISTSSREQCPYLLTVDREALEADRVERVEENHAQALQLVACGHTWLEGKLLIVDAQDLTELGEDKVGEIWIQGPHVAKGYWNQPEASRETFGATLPGHQGEFLRTGDLGFLHQGEVYVTGRIKDLIIVRGRNLYPQDLERSIDLLRAQIPEIRPGCGVAFAWQTPEPVSSEPPAGGPEQVVFFQEIAAGRGLDAPNPEALCRKIAGALSTDHLVPVHAVVLVEPGTLPKTSSGKLMRQACRQAYARGLNTDAIKLIYHWQPHLTASRAESPAPVPVAASADKPDAPRRWLLDWLSQACRLPVEAIDLDDRFQALGLDSLLSVRLVADLEQAGWPHLSETLLWEYPTPRDLLSFLDAGPAAKVATQTIVGHTPVNEAIAVIGMSCRFPGNANTPQAFWELLDAGRDAIGPIPVTRWDIGAFYDPQKAQPGKMYVDQGGFLDPIDGFEPAFFRISPREATEMDPQQRLLLELAWESLENAGIDAATLFESPTGVFVGISNIEYGRLRPAEQITAYSGTGTALSVAAGRLAYWLGLQGPAVSLDTACSSSLVAVHQACQSLRSGECELAFAGGVNLILSPQGNVYFSQLQALAADGRCKSFDAAADGFVRSEGGGLVLLKRLSDAERDGDRILGLIPGSAINHDGPSNGLTAPNGKAQQKVIRQALQQAGVAAEAISYVETHGTGTALGDPIEVQALQEVLLSPERTTSLYLGAVKSNLGHTESAAGVAGLIKTLLALQHRRLPANLHFHQLNPRIAGFPLLEFPTTSTPWPSESPRLAGVSSFGISGTNAHLILQEYIQPEPVKTEISASYTIPISAHSEAALLARLAQLSGWLGQAGSDASLLHDLAYTTGLRRSHLRHRWALRAQSMDGLVQALAAARQSGLTAPLNDPRIAFVFSGQGAQWPGMGRELLASEPVFREAILRCEAAFAPEVDWRLQEALATATDEDYARMDLIQPVIFAIQIALASLWQSWGIQPQYVIGHSMGEVAAACIAGALSLEDAARVICRRSRLLARQAGAGGMLFTALTPAACEAFLSESVVIGVYNGPDSTVLTGERQALEAVQQALEAQEIFCRFVQVPVAAHSQQIDAFEAPLKAALAGLQPQIPVIPMLSTVKAAPLTEAPGPDYWYDNLRQPVRFAQTVAQALAEGVNLWIEISPHPLLLQTLQASAREQRQPVLTLASLKREQPELQALQQTLLQAYQAGANPRWSKLVPASGRVISLPAYPWQRQSFWLEAAASVPAPSAPRPEARLEALPAAPPKTITQQLVQLHWEKSLPPVAQAMGTGPWLIFSDYSALNESLAMLLQARGQHCLFVHQGHELQAAQPPFSLDPLQPEHYAGLMQQLNQHLKRPLNGVIFALRQDWQPGADFIPEQAESAYARLQNLLQHLEDLIGPPPRLYLVSQGAWQPQSPDLAQSVWWGLGRSAFYEYPQWHCTQIDLSPEPSAQEFQLLAAEVLAQSPESNLLLRGSERLVARLGPYQEQVEPLPEEAPVKSSMLDRMMGRKPVKIERQPASLFSIVPNAAYLISGGLGELGLETAQWLVAHGARHLALIGRSGAARPAQQQALAQLQAEGVQVEILALDVADKAALSQGLERLRHELPPLKGVIHAAGLLRDGLIAHQSLEAVREVFKPKIAGAWHLHQLTLNDSLDFFICYSSITAPLGMPGQANYAAANSFLVALMQYRRFLGKPALNIDWGPWHREDLVAAQGGNKRLMLSQYGFQWLEHAQGFALLERLLRNQASHAGVLGLDLASFLQTLPQTRNLPLLSILAREQGQQMTLRKPGPARGPRPQAPARTPSDTSPEISVADRAALPNAEELEKFLLQGIARILSLSPAELNTQTSLRGYGFDSLMALELKAQLQDAYGITLKVSDRFQSMTIGEMCERILGEEAES